MLQTDLSRKFGYNKYAPKFYYISIYLNNQLASN